MITTIIKRNGMTVPFDPTKIVIVMKKAFAAEQVPVDDMTLEQMTGRVVANLNMLCDGKDNCPTVEQVQDLVENTLDVARKLDTLRRRGPCVPRQAHPAAIAADPDHRDQKAVQLRITTSLDLVHHGARHDGGVTVACKVPNRVAHVDHGVDQTR